MPLINVHKAPTQRGRAPPRTTHVQTIYGAAPIIFFCMLLLGDDDAPPDTVIGSVCWQMQALVTVALLAIAAVVVGQEVVQDLHHDDAAMEVAPATPEIGEATGVKAGGE